MFLIIVKYQMARLLTFRLASSSGYRSIVANFGKIENKGIELSVNIVPVRASNFNWQMNYVFSRNRNKVLDLPAGLSKIDCSTYYDIKMVARAGQPMGLIEGPTGAKTEDGKYIATETGFYSTTTDDVGYGNVQRFYYGFK